MPALIALFLTTIAAAAPTDWTLRYSKGAGVVEWKAGTRNCLASLGAGAKPKPIAEKYCTDLQALLDRNRADFERLARAGVDRSGRSARIGPHVPLAEIEVGGLKLGVRATNPTLCNLESTPEKAKCAPASTRPEDRLGELARAALDQVAK